MKFYKILTCCLSFLFIGSMQAQVLDVSDVNADSSITADEKEKIIEKSVSVFQQYVRTGELKNEAERDEYLALFGFSAEVFRDFRYALDNHLFFIDPVEYVEQASVDFGDGLSYEILNPKLTKLSVGDDYNFETLITFEKQFSQFIDSEKRMNKSGFLNSKQEIVISIDPYDMNAADIKMIDGTFILPESDIAEDTGKSNSDKDIAILDAHEEEEIPVVTKKEKKKKKKKNKKKNSGITYKVVEQIFTASISGSTGSVSLNESSYFSQNGLSFPFASDQVNSTWTGIPGFDLSYRRSLGSDKKLYLSVRAGFELGKIETDISSFKHSVDSKGLDLASGATVPSQQSNGGNDAFRSSDENALIYILDNEFLNSSIEGGMESMDLYSFYLMPGLSYKLFESGSEQSRLFLNLSGGVNLLQSRSDNNVTYSGNIIEGLKLPDHDLFPLTEIAGSDYAPIRSGGEILSPYRTDGDVGISNLIGKSENAMSFGASLGLSFQKNFNWNFGLEFGADYYLSFSPITTSSVNPGSNPFLEGDISVDRQNSVLEQYYSDTALSKISLRLGLFFYLQNN